MDNLRISTMTACSSINSDINLDNLYHNINTDSVIPFIQHGSHGCKGDIKKPKRKSRKPEKKKTFFNQVTVHVNCEKIVNVKLFNNGKIQMTGLKYEGHGEKVLQTILPELTRLDETHEDKILNSCKITHQPMNIACINSDFSIGFPIKRDVLHHEIVKLGYYSSYEPCIYPGVNSKYYYNTLNPGGICRCTKPCTGKGDGFSDGGCKKITIAVFKSGEAIITGARSRKQLDVAHNFITDFVRKNTDILKLTE
jgi:TATA-box binding protein (TBP) (component of TFIID and TFIIIB)